MEQQSGTGASMDPEVIKENIKKYKKRRKLIWIICFSMLAAVIAYMVYTLVSGKMPGLAYKIIICGALGAFWVLSDVVLPYATHAMEGRTEKQVRAFRIYALLELAGYAGLAFFGVNAGTGGPGFYGALVYVLTMVYKRRFLDEYHGKSDDAEDTDSGSSVVYEVPEDADNRENAETSDAGESMLTGENASESEHAAAGEGSPDSENTEVPEASEAPGTALAEDRTGGDDSPDDEDDADPGVDNMPRYWKKTRTGK